MSENKVTTLTIRPNDVVGCVNHSSAAMLSVQLEGSEEIHDLFLTDDLLNALSNGAARVIKHNKKG